ncbi:flagellar brake protein [uncultured Pseudoteredinibacter sp.]|uniref:flagellar brake protein n=1 Tax=uncultured Pseudoteredinibacter sp. TaxID=1641701 RepID=UPI002639C20B|nr:flagellar brake protein [uncultured Pseudoteredinibacter sp.]
MTLWQKMFGRAAVAEERTMPGFFNELSQHETADTRNINPEVIRQLRVWQKQRQLIEVKSARQSEYQQSLILSVDLANGSFEIDELFPSQYHGQIRAGDSLHIRVHNGGQVQEMECSVLSYHHHSAMPYYSLAIPERIAYGQRRKQRRIAIDEDFPIAASLQTPVGQKLFGGVENLSCGGVRLRFSGNQLKDLYPGAVLPMCDLAFPGGFNIRCRAKLKGIQFLRQPRRHTSISLSFLDLAPAQRQQLEGLIEAIGQRCDVAA